MSDGLSAGSNSSLNLDDFDDAASTYGGIGSSMVVLGQSCGSQDQSNTSAQNRELKQDEAEQIVKNAGNFGWIDFRNCNLTNINFGTRLKNVSSRNLDIKNSVLGPEQLEQLVDLGFTNFSNVKFIGNFANIFNTPAGQYKLSKRRLDFSNADFSEATSLYGAYLANAIFFQTNFGSVKCDNVDFLGSTLFKIETKDPATFNDAIMDSRTMVDGVLYKRLSPNLQHLVQKETSSRKISKYADREFRAELPMNPAKEEKPRCIAM